MKIIDLEQGSESWHLWRRNGITSSNIAAIMGVCPYKKSYQVYEEMIGIHETTSTYAMERGKKYESEARDYFNVGVFKFNPICAEHWNYPHFRASLDGWDGSTVLEIKVPMPKNYDNFVIPKHYEYQLQWQMMVTEATQGILMVYSPEKKDMKCFQIHPDLTLQKAMEESANEFWYNIHNGIAPSNKEQTVDIEFEGLEEKIIYLKQYIEMIKWLQKAVDMTKEEILKIGEEQAPNASFSCYGLKVIKTCGKTTYDYKSMESDGIDLEKYKKQSKEGYRFTFGKDD